MVATGEIRQHLPTEIGQIVAVALAVPADARGLDHRPPGRDQPGRVVARLRRRPEAAVVDDFVPAGRIRRGGVPGSAGQILRRHC